MPGSDSLTETIELDDSIETFTISAAERGWGDGLPLIPPTEERVFEMLRYTGGRDPSISLGSVPPRNGEATLISVAANAVMAGCEPRYFPVVCHALEALLEPRFNLFGLQATTNPGGPLTLLNGPIAREVDCNAEGNAFGQGWRANATIGRAIRLLLLNIGGGQPQTVDRATHGFPGKYTMCVAENEAQSPWPPLHVDRNFDSEDSTVTVMSVQGFHNIIDITSKTARDVLLSMAAGMAAWGTNDMTHGGKPVLVLAPEHARIIADDGWTKSDVAAFLYEHARCDLTKLPQATQELMVTRRPKWINWHSYPLADSPSDFTILVIGGPGIHAMFLPSFGASDVVTRRLQLADGSPARSIEDFRNEIVTG